MNDRELLEKAARAAGIEITRYRLDDPLCCDALVNNSFRNPGQVAGPWNPLSDDGDALRLAVATRQTLAVGSQKSIASVDSGNAVEMHNGDPYAATRLAITRAAAAMVKP